MTIKPDRGRAADLSVSQLTLPELCNEIERRIKVMLKLRANTLEQLRRVEAELEATQLQVSDPASAALRNSGHGSSVKRHKNQRPWEEHRNAVGNPWGVGFFLRQPRHLICSS